MWLYQGQLQVSGYKALQMMTGKNVMELVWKNKPGHIQTDIQLPEILDLELTKMIKAEDDLKALSVSSFARKGLK